MATNPAAAPRFPTPGSPVSPVRSVKGHPPCLILAVLVDLVGLTQSDPADWSTPQGHELVQLLVAAAPMTEVA